MKRFTTPTLPMTVPVDLTGAEKAAKDRFGCYFCL